MKDGVRRIYRFVFPYRFRKHFQKLWFHFLYGKRGFKIQKATYGEKNPKKNFWVIKISTNDRGVFSIASGILESIEYLDANGYLPVVDLKNAYCGLIQPESRRGKENAWEYFFEQPDLVSLDEVYSSKNVTISTELPSEKARVILSGYPIFFSEEISYVSVLAKKYIRPSEQVKKYINQLSEKIPRGEKILGVSLRVNFLSLREVHHEVALSHAAQGNRNKYISDIEDHLRKWGYKYFFLQIDDRETAEEIRNYFGEKCIFNDRPLIHFYEQGKPVPYENKEKLQIEYTGLKDAERIDFDQQYVAEMYILSQCDSLFCGMSGNTKMAILLNGNQYVHREIYDRKM